MTTIEQIKAEIERLKGQLIRGACAAQIEMETNCKEEAYDEVLSFLSTLESEKPMNTEELKEEIDRLWESFADEMEGPHNLFDIYARLARHFAKWGAEHASGSSEIPNDLEEAAKEYAKTAFKKPYSDNPDEEVTIVEPDKYAGFIAGAKWQKEHSMSAEEVLIRAGLKPYKDGNQWCILAGDNIQEGICGFGDTIDEALYQFLMEVL